VNHLRSIDFVIFYHVSERIKIMNEKMINTMYRLEKKIIKFAIICFSLLFLVQYLLLLHPAGLLKKNEIKKFKSIFPSTSITTPIIKMNPSHLS
jgi:hypothetical protein